MFLRLEGNVEPSRGLELESGSGGRWRQLLGLGGRDMLLTGSVMSCLKWNVLNTLHCFHKQVDYFEKRHALLMQTWGIDLSEDHVFS